MAWLERIDQLLYAGEREERRVAVGDATVVVTTHRVLVFTSGSGNRPRYRQIDRPNVGGVEVAASGRLEFLLRTALLTAVASFAATVAILVSFRDLVPDLEAGPDDESGVDGAPGADAAGETLGLVETTFALVDVAVLSTAILAGLAACWYAARYVTSRSRRLVLEVYGDDDVEIPIDTVGVAAIELQNAIDPGHALSEASSEPPTETPDLDRSADTLESDGQAPLETGGDPAVDAYGIRADTERGVSDASSRSRLHSSGSRNESSTLESADETAASGAKTGPFVFGDQAGEPQADAADAAGSFDDSLGSPPDDPFDKGTGESEYVDPFEDGPDEDKSVDPFDGLNDSGDDPGAFADTENEDEDAGPAADLEWESAAAAPDWVAGSDGDGRDEGERDGTFEEDTSHGVGADHGRDAVERNDEVIDLSVAGSGTLDETGTTGDEFGDGRDEGERAGGESLTDDELVSDEPAADDEPAIEESPTDDESVIDRPAAADAVSSDRDPPDINADDADDADDAGDADNTDADNTDADNTDADPVAR